jgi:hypothetical protein
MAMDYYDLGNTDKYFLALGNSNQWLKGKSSTGYEPYYTDIMGFWPDLYRNSFTVSYTSTKAYMTMTSKSSIIRTRTTSSVNTFRN